MQSIYEFPLYYDILFDWDRDLEAGFYNQLLSQHDQNRENRVLEVGCGTAQIGLWLAALGWRVTGLDISDAMCEFVRQIALQKKLDLKPHQADMCDFALARHGAAFCPMSSFRVLQTDEHVLRHLSAMSKVVPQGIYILDLEISEEGQASDFDQWTMSRNGVIVSCKGADLIEVNDNGKTLRLNWGVPLRAYSVQEFSDLVDRSEFSIAMCFPERRNADDLSVFDPGRSAGKLIPGRSMLLLKHG